MKITSVAFSAYPAKDVPKLLKFYKDVLGLHVGQVHPNEKEAELVEFDIGNDHWFSLLPEAMIDRKAGSGVGVFFEVDDLDGMLVKIKAAGSKAEDAADYPSCRIASLEDPEGNKISLHQSKK